MSKTAAFPPAPEKLPAPVIDNHTHLESVQEKTGQDPQTSLDQAAAVNVTRIVQVGTDLASSRFSDQLAASDPRVLAAVAIHPNDTPGLHASGDLDWQLQELDKLAAQPRVRAIGETGLDFCLTDTAGQPAQKTAFAAHLALAKKHQIAMQIHDRDAHDAVVDVLRAEGAPERTVFHCFSGDAQLAKICNDNGWYMSFSGTVTFKNAPQLREALLVADPQLLLVETDAPYLTADPCRGRPNAPFLLPLTVRRMAAELNMDLAEFCQLVTANTLAVYGSWEQAA